VLKKPGSPSSPALRVAHFDGAGSAKPRLGYRELLVARGDVTRVSHWYIAIGMTTITGVATVMFAVTCFAIVPNIEPEVPVRLGGCRTWPILVSRSHKNELFRIAS
jgi:hypothetical protein